MKDFSGTQWRRVPRCNALFNRTWWRVIFFSIKSCLVRNIHSSGQISAARLIQIILYAMNDLNIFGIYKFVRYCIRQNRILFSKVLYANAVRRSVDHWKLICATDQKFSISLVQAVFFPLLNYSIAGWTRAELSKCAMDNLESCIESCVLLNIFVTTDLWW